MSSIIEQLETSIDLVKIKAFLGFLMFYDKTTNKPEEIMLYQLFYTRAKEEFDKYCNFVNSHKKEIVIALGDKQGKCSEYENYISPLFFTIRRYSPFTDIIFNFIMKTDMITEEDLKSRYSLLVNMFRQDNLERYVDYTDQIIEYNFKHFKDEKYNDMNNRGPLHYLCMFLNKKYRVDDYFEETQLNEIADKMEVHNKLIDYYFEHKPDEIIRYDNFHHIPLYYCLYNIPFVNYVRLKGYQIGKFDVMKYIHFEDFHPTALNTFMNKLLIKPENSEFIGISQEKYYLMYHNEDEHNEELLKIIKQLGYDNIHDYLAYNKYIIYYDVDHKYDYKRAEIELMKFITSKFGL